MSLVGSRFGCGEQRKAPQVACLWVTLARRLVRVQVAVLLIWGVVAVAMGAQSISADAGADIVRLSAEAERTAAAPLGGTLKVPYQAKCQLPAARIQFASPAVGDLDHDAYQEIVVGTSDGWVYALKPDKSTCTILWAFDTAAALNAVAVNPSRTTIRGMPAIADLDGDGWNEVVVPIGTVWEAKQNGGVVLLSHDGHLLPGWPQLTFAKNDAAYTDGVATSPAVADLDGDGKKEIIVGAFDHRVYAWHYNGSWVKGWPRYVFDTVWSSPAVGDLDDDGLPEVVIGVDAHANPYYGSIDGGALYAFHNDGTIVAGFPRYVKENFESTPALVDLDGDGYLDIVIGGGSFYDSGPTGYKVHAFDRQGNYLPGWPVATGGHVTGSPAIADLDNDGWPDVLVGSWDGKFYAWRFNGAPAPGWPVTPKIYSGDNYTQKSAVVANLDGATNPDGKPEVFINSGWEVIVMDAGGNQLTWDGATGNPQSKPTYWADWTLDATPVVADVDGDGKLELITGGGDGTNADGGNGMVYIWKLPNSTTSDAAQAWPMFKRTADRLSNASAVPKNDAVIVRHNIPDQMLPNQSLPVQVVMRNVGDAGWASASHYLSASGAGFAIPARINLPSGSTTAPGQEVTFGFTVVAPATPGYYTVRCRMAQDGGPFGSALSLSIKVGNEPAYYMLRAAFAAQGGGLIARGLGAPIQPPVGYQYWERAVNFELTLDGTGYFLLDKTGYIMWAGTAPDIGSIAAESPAVELVLGPDRQGYYVINANGKLWGGGGYMDINPRPPTFNDGRVRSFAVTSDYRGAYVLDKNGNVYTGGTAKPLNPAISACAADSALKIKLTRDGKGYYVLDRNGGVHNGGAAPELKANYSLHLGEDWARDFALTEDGIGYFMMDKFGGIHSGGSVYATMQKPDPVWTDGTAVGLGVADSHVVSALMANPPAITELTTPSSPMTQVVKVDSTSGSMTWRAATNQSWLKLEAQVASTPGAIVITADPRGLPLGTHQAAVTISADGAANSPLTIPVQLSIVDHLHTVFLPQIIR
jgi:hypothetical protein